MTPEFSLGNHEFVANTDLPPKSIIPHSLNKNFIVFDHGMVDYEFQFGAKHVGSILPETADEAFELDLPWPANRNLTGGMVFIKMLADDLEHWGYTRRNGLVLHPVKGTDFFESPQGQLFHVAKKS